MDVCDPQNCGCLKEHRSKREHCFRLIRLLSHPMDLRNNGFFRHKLNLDENLSLPDFPMEVIQPYPVSLNRSFSKHSITPDSRKYWVTTLDPGERDVLIYGATCRPSLTAFLAKIPAPSITLGFDVLVDETMAAMTAEPCINVYFLPSSHVKLPLDSRVSLDSPKPRKPTYESKWKVFWFLNTLMKLTLFIKQNAKSFLISFKLTRSCGRFGPDTEGTTVVRSSTTT